MELLFIALAVAFVALLPPAPYAPPELAACTMAHGFVIGEAPPFPGTVEIWNCSGKTVVTLNQAWGLPPDTPPVTRSHFIPQTAPGERLMGCRGVDENYDGTVAISTGTVGGKAQLRQAWTADIEKWAFVPNSKTNLVCNRGLTAP